MEVSRCGCGLDLEFEASHTPPRELVQRVAVEFFYTGPLPQSVHWELQ